MELAAPSMVTAPSAALLAPSLTPGQEQEPRRSSIIPAPDTPHLIVPHTATDCSPFAHGDGGQLQTAPLLAASPGLHCTMLPVARDRMLLPRSLSWSQQPAAVNKQPSSNLEGWLAGWAALASKPLPPPASQAAQPAVPTDVIIQPAAPPIAGQIMWPGVCTRMGEDSGASSSSKRARVGRAQPAQLPSSTDALAAFKAAWAGNVARSYVKWC
ncbi:hypothetical protein ABPG77_008866 [Micractinium sp. CCAP 211/92]